MDITILHNGQTFKVRVVYNFNQISNLIWLKFDTPLPELDKDLLLLYEDHQWQMDGPLKDKYPGVFEQLMSRLKNIFTEAMRCMAEYNTGFNATV